MLITEMQGKSEALSRGFCVFDSEAKQKAL